MSASEVGGAGPEAAAVPAGDDGSETPQQQQTEEQLSALRENLARKGKNSYYYAHDRVMDTPSWDGRSAPRRLATTSATKPAPKKAEKVTDYAWANEKAKVKIYVPLEGCADIEDDSISLKWEARCLDLEVTLPFGVARRLHIPSLHDDITGATFRKKKEQDDRDPRQEGRGHMVRPHLHQQPMTQDTRGVPCLITNASYNTIFGGEVVT